VLIVCTLALGAAVGWRVREHYREEAEREIWGAVSGNQVELVDWYLRLRPDLVRARREGCQPLHLAAYCRRAAPVIPVLVRDGADLEAMGWIAGSAGRPLHFAADSGGVEAVAALLGCGADPNGLDPAGRTPLHLAATRYSPRGEGASMAELLLDAGARIEARDRKGLTPLNAATGNGNLAAARLLLDRGADMNTVNLRGATPLHAAAGGGHEEMARLLIERGADVNARDDQGNTPLHRALSPPRSLGMIGNLSGRRRFGTVGIIPPGADPHAVAALLIEKGADPGIANERGETPRDYSRLWDEAMRDIFDRPRKVPTP
jgi:ankyrin repeat protein